jgi:hypothetical protein
MIRPEAFHNVEKGARLPLFLLASAFFGWLAAADAYTVLDLLAAGLAWATSAGLAHRNLLDTR